MDFIGRTEEQKVINDLLSLEDKFQSCLLYGRRRLGKTELLKHVLLKKGKPCIFFQCSQGSEVGNTLNLTSLIKEVLNVSYLSFNSFVEALEYLFKYSCQRELYVVIDEYPYINKLVEGLDSKIQFLIDKYHNDSKMKFFLSGSSISTMEGILSESNPLYRRFNLSILLKEMDYFDSSKFYPLFSLDDKVRLYTAFGGVPFYNGQINEKLTVEENIIKLLSGKFSRLLDDITINIKEELTKINNANQIFMAIAKGAFHYTDILTNSNLKNSSALYDTLDILVKMDLIEYVCPINDKLNKRKSGYRIVDNTINFYYRYLYNKNSEREVMNEFVFYNSFIKDDFSNYLVPKMFERISRDFLVRLNRNNKLDPFLIDIGKYWYDDPVNKTNGEFDVVGKTMDGYVFYEVKYTNKPLDIIAMDSKIKQINMTNLKPVKYGFISKNGFEKQDNEYQLYTLKDLYNLDD